MLKNLQKTAPKTAEDTATATTPRERNIPLKFQKIITPNGAKIRIRDKLGPLLVKIKVYTFSNGQAVPEDIKKNMVAEDVKCLNAIALVQCIKMKQSLDLCYINNRLTWRNVPERYRDIWAGKIEKAAAKNGFFIDRCQGKWAAKGLLANHWQDNFNPKVYSLLEMFV
ncbi:hypothetical protein G6F56_013372 [Rhizopus delemar]|nr:hypothetical protein G6F56_013372 [Rhizopus delemar]